MWSRKKKGKMRVLICETAVSSIAHTKALCKSPLGKFRCRGNWTVSPGEMQSFLALKSLIKGDMILVSTVQNTASCWTSHPEMLNTLRSKPSQPSASRPASQDLNT